MGTFLHNGAAEEVCEVRMGVARVVVLNVVLLKIVAGVDFDRCAVLQFENAKSGRAVDRACPHEITVAPAHMDRGTSAGGVNGIVGSGVVVAVAGRVEFRDQQSGRRVDGCVKIRAV